MTKIIYNGKIYQKKGLFCEALVIDKGRIAASGSTEDMFLAAPQNPEKIDAEGALIVPAFHDSHLHLMWAGRRAGGIECNGAKSIDEIIKRGRELIAALKPQQGSYILGDGIDPDLFSEGEKREPQREDMDKISPEHPVILSRHCGHTIYCNTLAMKRAGLNESTPEVTGGTVEKDRDGRPAGIFRENAAALIRNTIPQSSIEDMKGHLRLAMKKAHSLGITSCGSYDSNGSDFENIVRAYREIYNESLETGIPGLRITMQCGISGKEENLDFLLDRGRAILWKDPVWGTFLKQGSVKLFADGTLGGHTAWMRQPYQDRPDTCGIPVLDKDTLNHFVQKAAAGGMQVLVHAIGDACIDAVLEAFEKVTKSEDCPGGNLLRHGIIHCQITSPDLIERMARNRIYALVQPIFLADDMHILEKRVGKQLASTSYAWGSMERLGVPVCYSTDAPVSSMDPLLCIEWAVLRRDCENSNSACFCPGEKVDIYTAIDNYSRNAVLANFDEKNLGSIEKGRYADLVFLDRDIFSIPSGEIHKTKVLRTMCAGETVYSKY